MARIPIATTPNRLARDPGQQIRGVNVQRRSGAAGMQLGAAVGGLSKVAGDIADEQTEERIYQKGLEDTKALMEADKDMMLAGNALNLYMAENPGNPDGWESKAAELLGGVDKKWAGAQLGDAFDTKLKDNLGGFAGRTMGTVQTRAAQQRVTQVVTGAEANLEMAEIFNNRDAAMGALGVMEQFGRITPEQRDLVMAKFDGRAAYWQGLDIIAANPLRTASYIEENSDDLTAEHNRLLRKFGDGLMVEVRKTQATQVLQMAQYEPEKITPDILAQMEADDIFTSADIVKIKDIMKQSDFLPVDEQVTADAWTALHAYDYANDTDYKKGPSLEFLIGDKRISKPMRDELKAVLEKKKAGALKADDPMAITTSLHAHSATFKNSARGFGPMLGKKKEDMSKEEIEYTDAQEQARLHIEHQIAAEVKAGKYTNDFEANNAFDNEYANWHFATYKTERYNQLWQWPGTFFGKGKSWFGEPRGSREIEPSTREDLLDYWKPKEEDTP